MKQFPISANSIKTFQQCKYKFKLQYYDRKPRRKSGPPLVLGSAVHAALEKLCGFSKNKRPLTEAEKDDVVSEFYKVAVDGQLPNWMIQEGLEMVRERIDNFDQNEKILGLELAFGGYAENKVYTPNGTPISGYIDKLLEVNPTTAAVVDYKTSKIALTQKEANSDLQLSMYDYAVNKMFPKYDNIILVLDYLRLGEVVSTRRASDRKEFEDTLDATYARIGEMSEKDMKPEINEYCNYCDFKDYCPAYEKSVSDPDLVLEPLGALSDTELVEQWKLVKAKKKLVVSREREIDMEVTDRIRKEGPLCGKSESIHIQQRGRTFYDPKIILDIIPPEELPGMVNINKKAVDSYVRKNPEKSDEISGAASVSFSAPYLRMRKGR